MNPYVFFVGCSRSGTTLLRRMGDAHPHLAVVPEQHWLPRYWDWRIGITPEGMVTSDLMDMLLADRRFALLELPFRRVAELIEGGAPMHYARLVTELFDLHGELAGKRRVGEKTPKYVRYLPTLHSLWPHAKIVHLIRDGRDVALSLLEWSKAERNAGRFPTWKEDPVATAALYWEWNVRLGREAGARLGPDRYCEPRYEALVADPEGECRKLCDFLALDYHPAMLRFHEGRTKSNPRLSAKKAWRPVTAGLRNWREQMSTGDLRRFEAAAGALLEELGYERAAGSPSAEELERAARLRGAFVTSARSRRWPVPAAWERVGAPARGGGARASRLPVPVLDPFAAVQDAAMPFLARATDPPHVERRLASVLGLAGLHLLAVRVVRHKPGRRCLIEYDVEWQRRGRPEERMTIVGKSRARGSPEASDEVLRAFWVRGFAADAADGISVAEPLGVLSECRMSLQRKAPGVPAAAALDVAGPGLARRIAEALCKLHRAGVPPRRGPHQVDDELQILHERLGRLGREVPEWRPRLESILHGCEGLAASLPVPSPRGIHRDFYSDQVIVDGARLCLVDFDLYCQGDPALDAGNFIGHLMEESLRRSGRGNAGQDLQRAFTERFLELSGDVTRHALDIYATLTLARHVELSTRFPARRPFTQALMELCEQRLAAVRRASKEVAVS